MKMDKYGNSMDNNKSKNWWWGYRHTSGTIQAKRYFGPEDILEAEQSPFCQIIIRQFEAKDRDDALKIISDKISRM